MKSNIKAFLLNFNKNKMKSVVSRLLLSVIIFPVLQVDAQKFIQNDPIVVEYNANACEANSVEVREIATKALNTNERVFILFRAGDGEGKVINNKRFTFVRKFMQEEWGLKNEFFLYAIGEKIKGQGRIEIYLGSKLHLVILAKRGKVPCMDCCGFDFNKGNF